MYDAQFDMFQQIFRSHQANVVNLAYKQLFSRDIYITVIKLSLELFEGVSLSALVMCSSLSLLSVFQELLGMGFYTCTQFILDETKYTSHAQYSGERHAKVILHRILLHRLGKPLRKLWIRSTKYFILFVYLFQAPFCCLLPA